MDQHGRVQVSGRIDGNLIAGHPQYSGGAVARLVIEALNL